MNIMQLSGTYHNEVFLLLQFPDHVAQFVLTEMSGMLFLCQLGDMLTHNFDPLVFMLLCFVQWHVKNTPKETDRNIFLITKLCAAVR